MTDERHAHPLDRRRHRRPRARRGRRRRRRGGHPPGKATVFKAQLKETGTHTGTASTGTFVGKLAKDGMMTYTLTFKGISGHLSSALIQSGTTGAKGALSVPLTAKLANSPATGTIKPSAALLTALRSGKATIWLKATKPTSALSGQAKA